MSLVKYLLLDISKTSTVLTLLHGFSQFIRMIMVFVAKKPHLYIPELQQHSSEHLNIGLYISARISESQAQSLLSLARAIRETTRTIRCLWLRFSDGDESDTSSLQLLGKELTGSTSIKSLILENNVGLSEILCLQDFLSTNTSIRGIKFQRTNLDSPAFILLHEFFTGNVSLKVLDLFGNTNIDDIAIKEILTSILMGRSSLETLNVGESFEEGGEGSTRITESGVEFILSFVRQTPSILHLKLRLRALSNTRIIQLANVLQGRNCNISRLELSGKFGDEGLEFLAEALKTNRTLKTISIGYSENLTNVGANAISQVCQDIDGSGLWESITQSNHTLRRVFISETYATAVSPELIHKLQTLTNDDSHGTLQNKVWDYIRGNMDSLPDLRLDVKLLPLVLAFIHRNGGHAALFQVLRGGYFPTLFTYPTPEKMRLKEQMRRIYDENRFLKALLESERQRNTNMHDKSQRVEHCCDENNTKKCCLLPFVKLLEWLKMLLHLLRQYQ